MSSVFEIVYSLVELMTQPLLLVNLCYQFGIRNTCRVVQTWIELLRSAVCLPLVIFGKLILWTAAIVFLPIRAFTALSRERLLAMHLYRMKTELDYLLWERKELDGRLNMATKERNAVEKLLKELEDENDDAIVKIELLERERALRKRRDGESLKSLQKKIKVQDLKEEMQRLKEVHGKSFCDYEHNDDAVYNKKAGKTNHLTNILTPEQQDRTDMIANDGEILARERELARTRSFFSATMSLVVGIIVWKAEDPCIPVVAALFCVVFMSLMSVIRFYSAHDHKPESEAVALLSFNWFILGTLTYPTLPRVACLLSPIGSFFLNRILKWFGT